MANNVYQAKNEYSHVPTEQLNEMLSSISPDEKVDMNELYLVVDELERRDPVSEAKVRSAWEDFQRDWVEEQSSCERKVIRFGGFRRLAIIAAIAAVLTVSAGALGLHYFWDRLEWDKEHFSFGYAQYAEEPQEVNAPLFENWDENKVYGSLQEALDDFGITEFAEPTWLPEGYEYYGELYVYCAPEVDILLMDARYDNEEYNVSVSITYSPPGERHNTWYQRSGDTYEEYICGDYTCLLFPNLDTQKIVWLTPNYECCISGWLTYDELEQIVDSIYLED